MDVTAFLIGAVTSFVGTLGFSLLVRIRPKYLFFAAFGGFIAFCVWFFCDFYGRGAFVSNFAGAAAAAIYSEILARIFKTPTIEFSLASIIPLTPGSFLYYAMSSFIKNDYSASFDYMITTLMIGFGIAAGMICVSIIPVFFSKNRQRRREEMEEKAK